MTGPPGSTTTFGLSMPGSFIFAFDRLQQGSDSLA